MKKKFLAQNLISIVFVLIIGFICVSGLYPFAKRSYNLLVHYIRSGDSNVSQLTQDIENYYNENFTLNKTFVSLNGGLQRVIGQRHVNDRYLLNNGHMTYTIAEDDVSDLAKKTVEFNRALEGINVPLTFVCTPFKIDADDKQLPYGAEDYSNENADVFVKYIRNGGVDCLDLREKEKEQKFDHYSMFFKTDHHWTADAGFWAFNEITDYLEEKDSTFAIDKRIKDIKNYNRRTYENVMFGTAARRTGTLYVDREDFTTIIPKFETELSFEVPKDKIYRKGSFENTMLFSENLVDIDIYKLSSYTVFCGSDYDLLETVNYSCEKNLDVKSLDKKLLILKDSFTNAAAPFFSTAFSEIRYVDLRSFTPNAFEYIKEYNPDSVIILYNPGAINTSEKAMFEFFEK